MNNLIKSLKGKLHSPTSAAPLAVFRILFGLLMLGSIIRFWANGWIDTLYIQPKFHFSYYGFEWVKPIGDYTYLLFLICGLSAFFIALGYKYRLSIIIFFLSFTYIELMDKTTYLNHYYFISLMSFLMIFLPADRYFSILTHNKPEKICNKIPLWNIFIIQLMLAIVYFYAGLAKLNSDWLIDGMPLKIWLPANQNLPIVGNLLAQDWFIYLMAWSGALYDLSIPFLLWKKKTRIFAYILVVFFHVFTRILFPIGMFPYVMILSTLIFFSPTFHKNIISSLAKVLRRINISSKSTLVSDRVYNYSAHKQKLITPIIIVFFAIQIILPFRYIYYPGELFWNEQGFRFSWRVMLMEKVGYITFIVKDKKSKHQVEIDPSDYLTPFQLKQMSFQPDFILEFAHYLNKEFKNKGYIEPEVYANSYVALNSRKSKLFIDPNVDLAKQKRGFKIKKWLLPLEDKIYGL